METNKTRGTVSASTTTLNCIKQNEERSSRGVSALETTEARVRTQKNANHLHIRDRHREEAE